MRFVERDLIRRAAGIRHDHFDRLAIRHLEVKTERCRIVTSRAAIEHKPSRDQPVLFFIQPESRDQTGDVILRRRPINRQIDVRVNLLARFANPCAERREGTALL